MSSPWWTHPHAGVRADGGAQHRSWMAAVVAQIGLSGRPRVAHGDGGGHGGVASGHLWKYRCNNPVDSE